VQNAEETIMLSKWPKYDDSLIFTAESEEIQTIKDAIKSIRNVRLQMNVAASRKVKIFVVTSDERVKRAFRDAENYLKTLASSSELAIQADMSGIDDSALSIIIPQGMIYLPMDELVDIEKEIERLETEAKKMLSEIERAEKKLANEGFVAKAPQSLIDEEKAKIEKYKEMLKSAEEQMTRVKGLI